MIDFVKEFVILLCIVYSLKSQEAWKRTIWLIILSAMSLTALGAYQVIAGNFNEIFWGFATVTPDVTQMRLSGPVGDPNFYGQTLVAVLPLAFYRLLDERKLAIRLVAGVSSFLLIFIILNSYSRGAFMGMVLVLILIAIERRVNFTKTLLIILSAFFIFPLLIPFLPKGFMERIETLTIFTNEEATVYEDASFRGRTSEVISGFLMFAEHPFLGVGIGNYEINYQDYAQRLGLEHRTEQRQAHSLYIEIMAETGSFGLITFVGLFISLLFGLNRCHRKLKSLDQHSDWSTWLASVQIGIIAYLTTSLFLHGDFIRYLWLFVALGATALHLSDPSHESPQSQL